MFVAFRLALTGWCAVWKAGYGVTQRVLNACMATGYDAALQMWHQRFRPKHFTHAGAREYGYLPRSGEPGSGRSFRGSYTQRKLRKFGHTDPLVGAGRTSGNSKRRSAMVRITTTGKGGRAAYQIPTFNYVSKGQRINMRKEFETVSPPEEVQMVDRFRRTVEARLIHVSQGWHGMQAGAGAA